MIEVSNLTKAYGDRKAVDQISFKVEKGEILGFLGQNGAGKTTTMKILTCFMPATSGTARIANFDTFEQPDEVKKRIGYLPETPPLYPELLVSEYLSFVADLRNIPSDKKQKQIDRVVEQLNLGSVYKRLIANLSKGFRQRVGLAQALVHDPEILIMDEPTVGLDPKQVSEARDLIKSMRKDRTVIYSTHILSEVAATCDRIIIIDQGRIVAQESLIDPAKGAVTKTELVVQNTSDELVSAIRNVSGVKDVQVVSNGSNRMVIESEPREELMAEVARTVVNAKGGLVRMSPVQLALEQHYLDLIGATRDVRN